jgi:hypothetical protein
MSNEFKHKDVGIDLSKTEWEGIDSHEADGQTSGDGLYFDGTNWKRSPNINKIPTAEALTISGGTVTPTLPAGLYANLIISGEGAAADDLTQFTLSASWIGKRIIARIANASMPITYKHGAPVLTKTDFTEDSVYDFVEYECIAVNTVIQILRSDNA